MNVLLQMLDKLMKNYPKVYEEIIDDLIRNGRINSDDLSQLLVLAIAKRKQDGGVK